LKGEKLKKGHGYDWKPLKEQLRRISAKELYDIVKEKTTNADKARKIVAKIESLPLLSGGQQTVNPIAGASSSSIAPKGKK
jgi:hypothetical protein